MFIAPSILSADFTDLKSAIDMLNNSECDFIHVDVMDGVFVPNITIGMPVIKQIKKLSKKPLDVHLMIVNPEKYIKEFVDAGADILSVHYEACIHLNRIINEIRNHNIKAGVVLNPHTNVFLLEDIINDADIVLLMSVNPGFGGQAFIENSYNKVKELKELISIKKSKAFIEVDGGIDLNIAGNLLKYGADILVAGNSIFSSQNPSKTISDFKKIGC